MLKQLEREGTMKRLVMPLTQDQVDYLEPYETKVTESCCKGEESMIFAQLYRGHAYVVHLEESQGLALCKAVKGLRLDMEGGVLGCPKCGRTTNEDADFCIDNQYGIETP